MRFLTEGNSFRGDGYRMKFSGYYINWVTKENNHFIKRLGYKTKTRVSEGGKSVFETGKRGETLPQDAFIPRGMHMSGLFAKARICNLAKGKVRFRGTIPRSVAGK
jgi:hypothetical protein